MNTPPTENSPAQTTLALVRDLLFASRITATARAQDAAVTVVREPGQLSQLTAARLLVDLNQPDALDAAIAWKSRTAGEVIGFVSHVDSAIIAQAKQGGLDRVLPRSQFVQLLPQLLTPDH
jgi:hypothetical protein